MKTKLTPQDLRLAEINNIATIVYIAEQHLKEVRERLEELKQDPEYAGKHEKFKQ